MLPDPEEFRGECRMLCAPECGWPGQAVLIPVCCVCGLIRDDSESGGPSPSWMELRQYRQHYGLLLADVRFTHTYCPACLMQVQERVRRYFAEEGVKP